MLTCYDAQQAVLGAGALLKGTLAMPRMWTSVLYIFSALSCGRENILFVTVAGEYSSHQPAVAVWTLILATCLTDKLHIRPL